MELHLGRRTRRFRVHDWSMAPTFVPGDIIRVTPQTDAEKVPDQGDAIVLRDPEMKGRKLLKRVQSVMFEGGAVKVFVIGDNPLRSRDSRHFGAVPVEDIIGRVVPTNPSASRVVRDRFS